MIYIPWIGLDLDSFSMYDFPWYAYFISHHKDQHGWAVMKGICRDIYKLRGLIVKLGENTWFKICVYVWGFAEPWQLKNEGIKSFL